MSQEALRISLESTSSARKGYRMWIRRFRRDKRAMFGTLVLAIFLICALFGPFIAPYEPLIQSDDLLVAPNVQHLLGTDNLGRDVLSRLLYSFRPYIISGPLALVLGTVAAGLLVAMRTRSEPGSAVRQLPAGGVLENSVGRL